MNERRFIEIYLPHHCAAQIAKNLETGALVAGEKEQVKLCSGIKLALLAPIHEFIDGRTLDEFVKFNRRMRRATQLAMSDTYTACCATALLALTIILQDLIDKDQWEPDAVFKDAWNRLGEAVYERPGNEERLDKVTETAQQAGVAGLERLKKEGYYQ